MARGEAGGGRGSVGERHASPLFVLLAEEEEDKGGGGGLGRLGELGRWWRQVRFLFSLCLFLIISVFLFCRFVLNLVLKPIQFILLLTIFLGAKRIKTMLHKIFQNYWTYIYLIVDINPIQIIIDLIQMPKIIISVTPKILV